ncbi:MAG: hypothetical protein E7211_19495 [Clostridium lundense]|nr:hypothetical protein [Clostridium lundense]
MNEFDIINMMFNSAVNQALINKKSRWLQLPPDQQEALDKILSAIHDLYKNQGKIRPEYRAQMFDAAALKVASEIGWPIEEHNI